MAPQVDATVVGSTYFQTIRQPLTFGRDFSDHDDANAPLVAIINQTLARHRWPSEDPIGKRVSFDQGQHWIQIVGVVADAKEYGLDRAIKDEIYTPLPQSFFASNLVVRTAGDPASMVQAVRGALHDVDSQLALPTLKCVVHGLFERPRDLFRFLFQLRTTPVRVVTLPHRLTPCVGQIPAGQG